MTPRPIRSGDFLLDSAGNRWLVCRTLPGGKVELYDAARTYFCTRYHREVKTWARVSSEQRTEIGCP
jgi:hypothetical protein